MCGFGQIAITSALAAALTFLMAGIQTSLSSLFLRPPRGQNLPAESGSQTAAGGNSIAGYGAIKAIRMRGGGYAVACERGEMNGQIG